MYGRGIVDDNRFLQQFFSLLREHFEDIDGRVIFEKNNCAKVRANIAV
jgi:hypothetical protein